MTEHGSDDELEPIEPLVMRRMVLANQRVSRPEWRRRSAILLPIAVIAPLVSAATSKTNRPLNILVAVTLAWTYGILWLRRGRPAPPPQPPAYMTWAAQRWWIGFTFVAGAVTWIIAALVFAHRPLDQAIVLVIGMALGVGGMQLVRSIAKRRYTG